MALGPHPQRALTLTPRLGVTGLGSAWPQALAVAVGACFLFGLSVSAHDWPQFLGPQRNGVYTGPPLAASWPAGGPKKVWQKTIGTGVAGPVVAGDRLILFHRVNDEEVVDALDARTGAPRWHDAYKTSYRDDF